MPSPKQQDFLWIALGDIHEEIEHFADIPELQEADGIIITGDMTIAGGIKEAKPILTAIAKYEKPILAQIGNMDTAEVTDWLTENGWNIHIEARELTDKVSLFGVGASTFTPFKTPSEFSESDFTAWLEQGWRKVYNSTHKVLISHNPPVNTKCDVIGDNIHVGSTAVRQFIEEHQPDICICGHIHEARGIDHIGRTTVINPGNFGAGGYVVLRFKDEQLFAELKVLHYE